MPPATRVDGDKDVLRIRTIIPQTDMRMVKRQRVMKHEELYWWNNNQWNLIVVRIDDQGHNNVAIVCVERKNKRKTQALCPVKREWRGRAERMHVVIKPT